MSQIVPRTDREALLEASRGGEVFTRCYANEEDRLFDRFESCIPQKEVDRALSYLLEKIPQSFWSDTIKTLGVALPENSSFARLLHGRVRLENLASIERNQILDAILIGITVPRDFLLRFEKAARFVDNGEQWFETAERIPLWGYFSICFLSSECSPNCLCLPKISAEDGLALEPYFIEGSRLLLETMTDFRSYLNLATNMIRAGENRYGRMRGDMMDGKNEVKIFFELYVDTKDESEPKLVFFLREIWVLDPVYWANSWEQTLASLKEAKEFFDSLKEGKEIPERKYAFEEEPNGAEYGSPERRLRMMRSLVDALISAKVHQIDVIEKPDSIVKFNLKGRTTRDVMREMRARLWSKSLETQAES